MQKSLFQYKKHYRIAFKRIIFSIIKTGKQIKHFSRKNMV